ncbi:hypothetical protein OE88DRAFT_292464 [Heliocybe sulcata]|uniref:Uncharacterized protein n=1 Tax=Heliocybe sulcata TaxID=5364 RepID=A0A5C3MY35_9AGAM|nr:hypothetical protein OE88DRAFT_292464 [Heliocybe sulcata]
MVTSTYPVRPSSVEERWEVGGMSGVQRSTFNVHYSFSGWFTVRCGRGKAVTMTRFLSEHDRTFDRIHYAHVEFLDHPDRPQLQHRQLSPYARAYPNPHVLATSHHISANPTHLGWNAQAQAQARTTTSPVCTHRVGEAPRIFQRSLINRGVTAGIPRIPLRTQVCQ